jgi:hypothetical protein
MSTLFLCQATAPFGWMNPRNRKAISSSTGLHLEKLK